MGGAVPGVSEHERRADIVRVLEGEGQVTVSALARRYGVSLVTIRKDLTDLEARRLLRRIRGGAVRAEPGDEGTFEMRLRHRAAAKRAIARAAAALVHDGDAIALDCSTTCYYLAEELRRRRGLVVVTNGLRAAQLLGESDATVVLPGGTVRRSSWSLVGEIGDVFGGRGRVSRGFFGVRSISLRLGLMELSSEETVVKRRLAAASRQVYGLFDSSKVGLFALHSFAAPDRITELITDRDVADDVVEGWSGKGVPVRRTGGPA
jgi:DeoR family transcriptional regulator of aga operon